MRLVVVFGGGKITMDSVYGTLYMCVWCVKEGVDGRNSNVCFDGRAEWESRSSTSSSHIAGRKLTFTARSVYGIM